MLIDTFGILDPRTPLHTLLRLFANVGLHGKRTVNEKVAKVKSSSKVSVGISKTIRKV